MKKKLGETSGNGITYADGDIYYTDEAAGYQYIAFANGSDIQKNGVNLYGYGQGTAALDIPKGMTNPCFYAGSGDDSVYSSEQGMRPGYWAPLFTVFDPKKVRSSKGSGSDPVYVASGKKPATDTYNRGNGEAPITYVSSTLYDYYSDYELNGKEVSKNNKKAIAISKILEDTSMFLSTIQVAITLAGFLASAFASSYFADYIVNVVNITIISKSVFRTILVVLITIILSYFTLVFGELVPKKIAINNPYRIASLFVGLINVTRIIFYPLIKLLTLSTLLVCKIFRIKDKKNNLTENDIKKIILLGKEEGIIEEKEKEYILNIFEFNDIKVEQVMTPKNDVSLVNIDDDFKNILSIIKETKFSRYPVYKNNIDNIIGVLNVKDLILSKSENNEIDLNNLIRPIHKFRYNKKIDDVFRYMQEKNESLCAVYKNDKFIGIVSVEDAVEEIVGNIYDEYDNKKNIS